LLQVIYKRGIEVKRWSYMKKTKEFCSVSQTEKR
jgi:hypothetical protein